jgi:hypothetical protein
LEIIIFSSEIAYKKPPIILLEGTIICRTLVSLILTLEAEELIKEIIPPEAEFSIIISLRLLFRIYKFIIETILLSTKAPKIHIHIYITTLK